MYCTWHLCLGEAHHQTLDAQGSPLDSLCDDHWEQLHRACRMQKGLMLDTWIETIGCIDEARSA